MSRLRITVLLLGIFLLPQLLSAQTKLFRSIRNGDWGSSATWEVSTNGGTDWSGTSEAPSATNCDGASIRNGHTVTANVDYEVDQVTVESGGVLNIDSGQNFNIVDGAGNDLDVQGTVNSGSMVGPGSVYINPGGVLNLDRYLYLGAHSYLTNITIYNHGIINYTCPNLMFNGSAVINNESDGSFYINGEGNGIQNQNGNNLITNTGSIIKSTGSGSTYFAVPLNNNGVLAANSGRILLSGGGTSSGDFTAGSGAILEFYNNTFTMQEGVDLMGTGTLVATAGTTYINSTGTTNGIFVPDGSTLTISGATLTGTGKYTISGTLVMNSGALNSNIKLETGSFFNLNGSDNKYFQTPCVIDNNGTITWNGGNSDCGAVFNNHNLFEIKADISISRQSSAYPAINNYCTFKKSTGTGSLSIILPFNNLSSGSVLVETGTMVLGGGGTIENSLFDVSSGAIFNFHQGGFTFENGALFSGSGTTMITNTAITINISGGLIIPSGHTLHLNCEQNLTVSSSLIIEGKLVLEQYSFSGSGLPVSYSSGSTLEYRKTGTVTTTDSEFPVSGPSNVIVNKTGTLNLHADRTISGTLTMSNGIINTGSNTLTIGTGTSATGNIIRTGGILVGNIKRWFAASTISDAVFPVGTLSYYRPASVTFTSAPGTGGTLTASFISSDPGTSGLPLDDAGTSILRAGCEGYWSITPGDGLSGGNYIISLTASGFLGVSDFTKLRVLKRSGSSSNWTLEGTHSDGTGTNENPTAHRTGLSTFSQFGIGSSSENPLPVELVSFTVFQQKEYIALTWRTITETDNYGFAIERKSAAEDHFKTIAFIQGAGNSNSPREYSYTDKGITSGSYIYRLKQVDNSGKFTYSDEVSIFFTAPLKFSLGQNYPNPFNPNTTISYSIPYRTFVALRIFDAQGQQVQLLVGEEKEAGSYSVPFDASALAAGIYVYKIQAGDLCAAKKLLVLK